MNDQLTLTLLCGFPRVGKSTWANNNKGNDIIVSVDEIRKEIFGHKFHVPANKMIFSLAESMTSLLLKQGKNVIVDATHINKILRDPWRHIAKKYNAKTKLVWIYTSKDISENIKICIERNQKSNEEDKIPEGALYGMSLAFEEPEENWYEIIEYRNI